MAALSPSDVIALAACHVCCAFRREPCVFNREEDPEGRKAILRLSHGDRENRAIKNYAEIHNLPVDSISLLWQGEGTESAV